MTEEKQNAPAAPDMNTAQEGQTQDKTIDYGLILLAIPLVSTLLIWFWVGSMSLLQNPASSLGLILIATSLGTAAVAAYEVAKTGANTNPELNTYSPTAWFFLITLLWVYGYPLYLYKRKQAGLANRIIPGVIIGIIYIGSWILMLVAVEEQKAELLSDMEQIQSEFEAWE